MNDAEVITAVKASYAGIHMDVPLDVIVRRGRRLRAHRRLPGLAVAAVIVAALALAVSALVPGSGGAGVPGGSTGTERPAAWTVVSQPNGSVRVALRWPGIRDEAGLQDRLRADGIPARVARFRYLHPPLNVPGCHVFGDWSTGPGGISSALWHKIFYGPHTGQQSNHAFWVYRSAIPRGLGVLVDIYYDGTFGLYVVKASPQCTGT
jgi:hypothetical protein